MAQLDTRGQHASTGRERRMNDAAAQQRALSAMGVEVALSVLRQLPPGGWLRYVPKNAPRRGLDD